MANKTIIKPAKSAPAVGPYNHAVRIGELLFCAGQIPLDPATGKTLWHLNAGGHMAASPMTYQLDGLQYLIAPIQDVLYAFALPENAPSN